MKFIYKYVYKFNNELDFDYVKLVIGRLTKENCLTIF